MFDVWPDIRYLRMFHRRQYVVCICSIRNGSLLTTFVPTSQFSIYVGLHTICLHLMCASTGLTYWIVLESYSYVNMEVFVYIFVRFILVFDCQLTFKRFCVIYILFRFNHVSMVIIFHLKGFSWRFPLISSQTIILCEPLLNQYT